MPLFWCGLVAMFCRGTILPNYIVIWQADSAEKNFKVWTFCSFSKSATTKVLHGLSLNNFDNFKRGPPNEHSFEVWLKLVLCFRRRFCLKLKVNDRQRVIRIDHLELRWSNKLTFRSSQLSLHEYHSDFQIGTNRGWKGIICKISDTILVLI